MKDYSFELKNFLNAKIIHSQRAVQNQVARGPKSLTPALNQNLTQRVDASQDQVVSAFFSKQDGSSKCPSLRRGDLWPSGGSQNNPLVPQKTQCNSNSLPRGRGWGWCHSQISQEKACGCLKEKVEIKTCRGFSYPALKLKSNLDENGCIEINHACEAFVVRLCTLQR